MKSKRTFSELLKPAVPKRALFFIAGMVWAIAGSMLFWRGLILIADSSSLWKTLLVCAVAGLVFYILMFDKIAKRYTERIRSISLERPCAFSFFGWRGYLIMSLMISLGVVLRISDIVAPSVLASLYITMGVPLSLSAIRFIVAGFANN